MSKFICSSCTEDIESSETNLMVTCFACEKHFHGFSCIGLSKPQLKTIKEVRGVLWNCEHCSVSTFTKFVCHKLSEISEKVPVVNDQDAILSRLDLLTSEMDKLKKNVDSLSTSDLDIPGGKRSRTGQPRPLTPRFPGSRFEWPKASTSNDTQAITGTNVDSTSLKAVEIPSFFHVSRFNPTTTEEELKSWISKKLEITDDQSIKCWRLIPKGRELSNLEFISFKIGVLKELEVKIMDPSIWPTNITVRPFEQRAFLQRSYPSIA